MTSEHALRAIERYLKAPRRLRWCVPGLGMAALWWSSSRVPGGDLPAFGGALVHNAMHVVAYGLVAGSAWLAWSRAPAGARQRLRSTGAWALGALYGVVDELHQAYVPGRDCSMFDVLSDFAGAALAVALLRGVVGVSKRWRLEASVAACLGVVGVVSATFLGG